MASIVISAALAILRATITSTLRQRVRTTGCHLRHPYRTRTQNQSGVCLHQRRNATGPSISGIWARPRLACGISGIWARPRLACVTSGPKPNHDPWATMATTPLLELLSQASGVGGPAPCCASMESEIFPSHDKACSITLRYILGTHPKQKPLRTTPWRTCCESTQQRPNDWAPPCVALSALQRNLM